MAIWGVKPVDYAYWLVHNTEYYTNEKVRDILINFANSKNAMCRDMTAEQIVDEFMESGE